MKLAEIIAIVFYVCVGLSSIYWMHKSLNAHNNLSKRLPCNVSEISPDFSHADREKCRMIRGHKL